MEDKTLEDFKDLKKHLTEQIKKAEQTVVNTADKALQLILDNGLEFSDFSRGTLPNHFKKAKDLNFFGLYSNQLEQNINEGLKIYNKTLDASVKRVL